MVLAAVMSKMGLYGLWRLVLPIVPDGVSYWQGTVIVLSVIGALYGGVIAFRQWDLKRLVAYSSLSHVGILCAGLFALNGYGAIGAFHQTFAHAIMVVALLYITRALKERVGSSEMGAMGGLKQRTPRLAALFLLVLMNALALPLTQGFIGEWLMFIGIWQVNGWMAVGAVATIVVGAIYLLHAYQRVMLGEDKWQLDMSDATSREHFVLVPLIAVTLLLGVHPEPVLDLIDGPVQELLSRTYGLPG
jgi:NADH-quinone oxidoreductase subunit M